MRGLTACRRAQQRLGAEGRQGVAALEVHQVLGLGVMRSGMAMRGRPGRGCGRTGAWKPGILRGRMG